MLAALMLVTGCSITHHVADDYARYLGNNVGAHRFETAHIAKQYHLPSTTRDHHYEFRAATTGYANLWVVEFGTILDATMRSRDIIEALGNMSKAATPTQATGNTIIFDLNSYSFEDFGAHIKITISIRNANGEVFKKSYVADGRTQGSKMFWGGVFGMKNAIQQSSKTALDQIITAFIRDVKASPLYTATK